MTMKINLFSIFIIISTLFYQNCQPAKEDHGETVMTAEENPAAEGFNVEASDSVAVAIADQVMKAMGGRQAWDNTQFIAWNFFGNRKLVWDKTTGDVRVESLKNDFTALINIYDNQGRVMKDGEEITQPDSLQKYVNQAKNMWINDSYWLVMPFKLKDSGVTLTYEGEDTLTQVTQADVLQLTFENVGHTPDNKYKVWVDQDSDLIKKWAFYRTAEQDTPNIVTPWENYQQHGEILLSGDRGRMEITDIMVFEELPEMVFDSFEPVDLSQYEG